MKLVLAAAGLAEMDPECAAHFFDPIVAAQVIALLVLCVTSACATFVVAARVQRNWRRTSFVLFLAPDALLTIFFFLLATAFGVSACLSIAWLTFHRF